MNSTGYFGKRVRLQNKIIPRRPPPPENYLLVFDVCFVLAVTKFPVSFVHSSKLIKYYFYIYAKKSLSQSRPKWGANVIL